MLAIALTGTSLRLACREVMRDHLVPHAVSWYTGEAAELEDDDYDGDGDDDEDDEDEVQPSSNPAHLCMQKKCNNQIWLKCWACINVVSMA